MSSAKPIHLIFKHEILTSNVWTRSPSPNIAATFDLTDYTDDTLDGTCMLNSAPFDPDQEDGHFIFRGDSQSKATIRFTLSWYTENISLIDHLWDNNYVSGSVTVDINELRRYSIVVSGADADWISEEHFGGTFPHTFLYGEIPIPDTGVSIFACCKMTTSAEEYTPAYMKWRVFGFGMDKVHLPPSLCGTASTIPEARDNVLAQVAAAVATKNTQETTTTTLKRARNERDTTLTTADDRTTKRKRVVAAVDAHAESSISQ